MVTLKSSQKAQLLKTFFFYLLILKIILGEKIYARGKKKRTKKAEKTASVLPPFSLSHFLGFLFFSLFFYRSFFLKKKKKKLFPVESSCYIQRCIILSGE